MTNQIIRIEYDEQAPSPCDINLEWCVISFLRSHANWHNPDKYLFPNIGLRTKLKFGLAFYLDYTEEWKLFETDGRHNPKGIIFWDYKAKLLGCANYQDRRKDAENFLRTYNDWANGLCFQFFIKDTSTSPFDGDDASGEAIGYEDLALGINQNTKEEDVLSITGNAAEVAKHLKLKAKVMHVDDGFLLRDVTLPLKKGEIVYFCRPGDPEVIEAKVSDFGEKNGEPIVYLDDNTWTYRRELLVWFVREKP